MTTDELDALAIRLRDGALMAIPTETVYGLAANAWDARAVARIFEIKQRPRFNPLIVHLADAADLPAVAAEIPDAALRLTRRFWPGPLTLVLPRRPALPEIVTAGLATVAVRVPDHDLTRSLLRRAGVPVAAPSANPSGAVSPTTAEHVRRGLGKLVDAVLDGGPCRVGVESTILGWRSGVATLLRPGGLDVETIESEIGPVQRRGPVVADAPDAPGQLLRHYAPGTPLRLLQAGDRLSSIRTAGGRVGWIGLQAPPGPERFAAVEVLSASGDLCEAATRLFAALHRLDAAGLDEIVACAAPERGLGLAINDRLRRAAAGARESSSC